MNTSRQSFSCLRVFVALGLLALAAGCASTPKVDWDSRVGNYTHDQAVRELGPPDKTATLADGTTVSDWVKRRSGGGLSVGFGTGVAVGGGVTSGVGVGHSAGSGRDHWLRLTFGPDGKLARSERGF